MHRRADAAWNHPTKKMTMMTFRLPMPGHALGTALARIVLVLALLSAPMLALAGSETDSGRFVGTEIQRSNGAGLVIVFGLQRAR